jgi:tRNA threonylcarbamoyladenosine modification (KEOPS) complex  Pcc1 subunit
MSTGANASIRLKFDSEKQLDTLLAALTPEAEAPPTHRSTVKLKKEGTCLTLAVTAEDTVALRATLNAYLHWIQSTLNVIGVVEKA